MREQGSPRQVFKRMPATDQSCLRSLCILSEGEGRPFVERECWVIVQLSVPEPLKAQLRWENLDLDFVGSSA